MKLSGKPCYPMSDSEANARYADLPTISETGHALQTGLNFRERLIIALASNSSLFYQVKLNMETESGLDDTLMELNTNILLYQADTIIKQLEEEA